LVQFTLCFYECSSGLVADLAYLVDTPCIYPAPAKALQGIYARNSYIMLTSACS